MNNTHSLKPILTKVAYSYRSSLQSSNVDKDLLKLIPVMSTQSPRVQHSLNEYLFTQTNPIQTRTQIYVYCLDNMNTDSHILVVSTDICTIVT